MTKASLTFILTPILTALFTTAALANDQGLSKFVDKPVKVIKVALKPDPVNPHMQRSVSCSIYRDFMVKEIDFGEKGAEQLSFLPVKKNVAPVCQQKNLPQEQVLTQWQGYFAGVKSGYAFFVSDDASLGGGMSFLVMRLEQAKPVFVDEVTYSQGAGLKFSSIEVSPAGLKMRYTRSYMAPCSVVETGEACLDTVAKGIHVAKDFASKCKASYKNTSENSTPSYLSYEVEAVIPVSAPAFNLTQIEAKAVQGQANSYIEKKSDIIDCTPMM